MTEHETIPGAVYAVEAEGHIQVINPAGVVVYEGENALSFPAVHASYDILPEGAAVRQVFKCAPRTKLHLLMGGAGGWLPKGFTELEYLEGSGTQWINTGKSIYGWSSNVGVETRFFIPGSEGHASFKIVVFGCRQSSRVKNFEVSGYESGLLRWGTQHVPYCTLHLTNHGRDLVTDFTLHDKKSTWLLETGETSTQTLTEDPEWLDIPIYLFALNENGKTGQCSLDKIYFFRLFNGQELVQELVPILDADATPCMYDKISRQCFYNAGTGDFIAGLTLRQARELRLPSGGGSLTLSLPYEASVDAAAQAALERARAAGWTLTLQYRDGVLPAGYRKLEFLESTGTQWIDTGVTTPTNTWMSAKVYLVSHWGAYPQVYGTKNRRADGTGDEFYDMAVNGARSYIIRPNFTPNWETVEGVLTVEVTYRSLAVNGKVIGYGTQLQRDVNAVNNMYLFAGNNHNNGSNGKASEHSASRIWYFKLYNDAEILCDLIPALDPSGVPCMFDTVTATPFYNSGTGAFIAGLATIDDVRTLYLAPTGGSITLSVPAETPQGYIAALQRNNPTWTSSIQYRES